MSFDTINYGTGFANGDFFEDATEVRAYFTPESQERMFGRNAVRDGDALRQMAETVISNRWHMASIADEVRALRRKVGGGAGRDVVARLAELLSRKRGWIVRFDNVHGGPALWAGPPRRSVNSGTLSEHGTVAREKDARKFRRYEDAEKVAEGPGEFWTSEVVQVEYELDPPRFRVGDKVRWFADVVHESVHPRSALLSKRHVYRDVAFGEVVGVREDEFGRLYSVMREEGWPEDVEEGALAASWPTGP